MISTNSEDVETEIPNNTTIEEHDDQSQTYISIKINDSTFYKYREEIIVAMANNNRHLSKEEINRVYEILGMANEEQRQQILSRLSFSQEKNDSPIRIKGDSVTTPYTDTNA